MHKTDKTLTELTEKVFRRGPMEFTMNKFADGWLIKTKTMNERFGEMSRHLAFNTD